MAKANRKIKIMVGSTVYGFEDQLSQITAQLQLLNYDVLNSHKGSIKVNPKLSNLDNCLNAVKECDLFLGIIRPYYGTGNIGEVNITFEEIKLAINLKKPYWFLVHRDVVFARLLFNNMEVKKGCEIIVKPNKFFDKRTIEIYDFIIQNHEPVTLRNGNWAQEFYRLDEMMTYITTQFEDMGFVTQIMNEKTKDNGK
ncbi:MAG: DUF4062 domain-containing protein [Limnohabitans sp.]|nr:DUF4062 domain-containing protein [Limnohabitans sp.]